MRIWIALGFALAVLAAIAALGTAAALRYGVRGRRLSAGVVVVVFVLLMVPTLMAPKVNSPQAQAITCLRAINAAQLLYQTNVGRGQYAMTLEDLEQSRASLEAMQPICGWSLRRTYGVELASNGERYAAIAVPLATPRGDTVGFRAFCVDLNGSIFQTLSGTRPAVDRGRCLDRSNPIQ